MYWVLVNWKRDTKNEYQNGISLLVLKINSKLNGWLHPVQLVAATDLLSSSTATTHGICCTGKAEQSRKRGGENLMCSAASATVLCSSLASALLDRRPWRGGRHDPLFCWECWCQWQRWSGTASGGIRKTQLWQAAVHGGRRLGVSHPRLAKPVYRLIFPRGCRKLKKHCFLWKRTLEWHLVPEMCRIFHSGSLFSWRYFLRPTCCKVAAVWSQICQAPSPSTLITDPTKWR